MCEHYAFRGAHSARGVDDGGDVVGSGHAGASVAGELLLVGLEYLEGVEVEDEYQKVQIILASVTTKPVTVIQKGGKKVVKKVIKKKKKKTESEQAE